MRKKILIYGLVLSLLMSYGIAEESLPPMPKGPLLLTSVTWDQLDPEYWINRLPNPDQVLLTPRQLKAFNEQIRKMVKDSVDVFAMSASRSGASLSKLIESEFNTVRGRKLFGVEGKPIPKSVFDETIKPVMNWTAVPSRIKMKWGVSLRHASIRALPTDVKMLEEIGDIEFDQLQFTKVKLWTPVGIFHTSSDGKWMYVQCPYSRGWVKSEDVALFKTRDELNQYVKSQNFLVVTGESVRIYAEPEMKSFRFKASMGTIIPIAGSGASVYEIWFPVKSKDAGVLVKKAFISKKADVTRGFLPYTQRHIIRQAFKLLGARYGWGGMYDGRDCSGFIQDVFLSMGVDMPRNSKPQAFVGTQIDHFEPFDREEDKIAALRSATPGITLLRMPLHMMLYIGEVDGQFYVIHSTWAERISMTSDEKNRINQVVVSDLSLNGNSYLGSLFQRTLSMNELQ